MHDAYDWFSDIVLPTFVGVGSIAVGVVAAVGSIGVGLVAAYVARQSHNLAVQVRKDEAKRDEDAARERYRDQLFRSVEPAVTAVLAHRAEILRAYRINVPAEGILRAEVVSRLWLVAVVSNEKDARLVHANRNALDEALATGRADVTAHVLGEISLMLPTLLHDARDIDDLVRQSDDFVSNAVAYSDRRSAGSTSSSS